MIPWRSGIKTSDPGYFAIGFPCVLKRSGVTTSSFYNIKKDEGEWGGACNGVRCLGGSTILEFYNRPRKRLPCLVPALLCPACAM